MARAGKREMLIDTAVELFSRNGYHATGVDRIMEATGISKATLYRHFNSKEELIVAALTRIDDAARDEMRAFVEKASADPRERLLATFGMLESWLVDPAFKGCPFIAAASEFGGPPNLVLQQVQMHKRLILAFFEELARAAGAVDAKTLARQVMMLHEGAVSYAQVFGAKGVAANARQAAETLLDRACQRPADANRGTRPR